MMKNRILPISITFALLLVGFLSFAFGAEETRPKKRNVKYRQYSEVDLSGATIQGKIRNPTVFYIFQRKRSESPSLIKVPVSLSYHHELTHTTLEGLLKP